MNESLFNDFQDQNIEPFLFDLFKSEMENQSEILSSGLLELEKAGFSKERFESLMRAAHSIKGAARVINLDPIVQIAHALEDLFVIFQKSQINLNSEQIDELLKIVDFFKSIGKLDLDNFCDSLRKAFPDIRLWIHQLKLFGDPQSIVTPEIKETKSVPLTVLESHETIDQKTKNVKISLESFDHLIGLCSEVLVETHWLHPIVTNLQKIKKLLGRLGDALKKFDRDAEKSDFDANLLQHQATLKELTEQLQEQFLHNFNELNDLIQNHVIHSERLYQSMVESRMRPFEEGVESFPRMVRDLARQLGKSVKLQIEGKKTLIDRDILEKLEAPLNHLIRNAIDHGIEPPNERLTRHKPAEGVITLRAEHRAGMFVLSVSDDGKGVDVEKIKSQINQKKLATFEEIEKFNRDQLLEFLYLPGFSTASSVTDISGRGVGLDVVRNMVKEVGGSVKIISNQKGLDFELRLPLTLSVLRALLVKIGNENYSFALARIEQIIVTNQDNILVVQDQRFLSVQDKMIPLFYAHEILEIPVTEEKRHEVSLVILSDDQHLYGLEVQSLVGETELVVQNLDARIGKTQHVLAGAVLEDGSPVLILDIDEIIISMAQLVYGKYHLSMKEEQKDQEDQNKLKILVVDDSLMIREMLFSVLTQNGYKVDLTENGEEAFKFLHHFRYHLIITDIEMPALNGFELIKNIRKESSISKIPILVLSSNDSEEDQKLSLKIGADAFLSKKFIGDERFLEIIHRLLKQ